MEGTPGWLHVFLPFLDRAIKKQESALRSEERKLVRGETNRVAYELGKLDGMTYAAEVPDHIRKGFQLRQGKSTAR